MAKAGEVLNMLCPEIQWVVRNDNYEEIDWLGAQPAITKKQFTDGFDKYDSWKAEQEQAKVTAKEAAQAKLAALGLTVEDLQALGL